MKKKATVANMDVRVFQVFRAILDGALRPDIIQLAADQWGVGERQADVLLKRAREMIEKHTEIKADKYIKTQMSGLHRLLAKATATGQLGIVLEVRREISKLLGLYADEKHSHVIGAVGKNGEFVPYSLTVQIDPNISSEKKIVP